MQLKPVHFDLTRWNDRVQIKRLCRKILQFHSTCKIASAINRVYRCSYHANTNPLVCRTMFDIFTSWTMSYLVELRFKPSVLLGRITVVDVKCFYRPYRVYIFDERVLFVHYITRVGGVQGPSEIGLERW